jgi:two-component system KDP operon response regulator KdpE
MNMPGSDGPGPCRSNSRTLRYQHHHVNGARQRRTVRALDAGADDYVTKPFSTAELLARIRARSAERLPGRGPATGRLKLQAVEIDFDSRQIARGQERVRLTPKEFDLLRHLVAHANKVLTHRELLQAVWGPDYGNEVDYLRVVVNQLRKKIEAVPSQPRHLLTEPWVGYRFSLPDREPG